MPPSRQNRPARSTVRGSVPPRDTSPTRRENVRSNIHRLFAGRSSVGRSRHVGSLQIPESPKSPGPVPTLQPVAGLGSRLIIPYLYRSASQSDSRSHSRADSRIESPSALSSPSPAYQSLYHSDTPMAARPITPSSWGQIHQSADTTRPERTRQSPRRFVGVAPAEQRLAALAQDARRRRRQKSRRSEARWGRCGPKIRNRRIRNKILCCFVSGIVSSKTHPGFYVEGLTIAVSHSGSYDLSRIGSFKPQRTPGVSRSINNGYSSYDNILLSFSNPSLHDVDTPTR